jgi:hypothetical protein
MDQIVHVCILIHIHDLLFLPKQFQIVWPALPAVIMVIAVIIQDAIVSQITLDKTVHNVLVIITTILHVTVCINFFFHYFSMIINMITEIFQIVWPMSHATTMEFVTTIQEHVSVFNFTMEVLVNIVQRIITPIPPAPIVCIHFTLS